MILAHQINENDVTVSMKQKEDYNLDKDSSYYIYGLSESRLNLIFNNLDLSTGIKFSRSFIKSNEENTVLRSDLEDMEIYIFRRWVLEVICDESLNVGSIKIDLLPLLVKNQHKKKLIRYKSIVSDDPDQELYETIDEILKPECTKRVNIMMYQSIEKSERFI
jgi:hypothetical protein